MKPVSATSVVVLLLALVAFSQLSDAAKSADRLSNLPDFPAFRSNNYAGYLPSLDGRKGYYWFVESESRPTTDPLMFWFNGGPGCSSLLGLFTELGPFILINGGVWARNDYTWVTNMNIVFMESPGGVGFSPDLANQTNWNDTYVAQLNYAMVQSFLAEFPEYSGRDLWIAGESYAGHYVPQLVDQIVSGPNTVVRSMLKGFMAGNPCTGAPDGTDLDWCFAQDDITYDLYLQTHALSSFDTVNIPNLPSDTTPYDPYNDLVRTCDGQVDSLLRRQPSSRRFAAVNLAHSTAKLLHGDGEGEYGPCSEIYLTKWLQRPDVVAAIHAEVQNGGWASCYNNIIYPTSNLTHGVLPLYRKFMDTTTMKILVYSGTSDTVVNFIQTEKILISLNRPLANPYYTPWYYQDVFHGTWKQLGGYYTQWDRISWASIRGAGHMVPTYQPAAMKQLLNSFLTTGIPGALPPNSSYAPTSGPATSNGGNNNNSSLGLHELLYTVIGMAIGIVIACVGARASTMRRKPLNNDAGIEVHADLVN